MQGENVDIATELTLSGAIARVGRASIVQDMASQLVEEFASGLRAGLQAQPAGEPSGLVEPSVPTRPISTFRLLMRTLRRSLRRIVGRA